MIINFIEHKFFRGAFEQMFFRNEFGALNDKSGQGLLKLFGITLLTFLALGLSIGSLQYLEERMDNPLTNWIYVFPNQEGQLSKSDDGSTLSILQLKDSLEQAKKDFGITNVSEFSIGRLDFFNRKNISYYGFQRTLSFEKNKDLLESILNRKNLVYKKELDEEAFAQQFDEGKGLIFTENVIKDVG